MSRKAVFFDADGTVCDMKKGVPDSAIEAIRALVNNGHEAWLCTGRSRAFVPWYLEQIKTFRGGFKKIRPDSGNGRCGFHVL